MFFIQCTHLANEANDNVKFNNVQNTAMVLKHEICEFQNGEKNKRISNHWPGSVVTNIHINWIKLIEKQILAGEE